MPLLKLIRDFFSWLSAVLAVFLRTHPVLTPVVILFRAAAQITRLLAFFLPLKVLLLVASPGVPRYFQFFIDSQNRDGWVLGLSAAAVSCYLLTIVLDRFSDSCSEIASRNLLQKASQMSVIGNQRELAKRHFSSFSGLAANLLLAGVIFSVGFYVYPQLFVFIAGLVCVQVLVTWAALKFVEPAEPAGFPGYILRSTNNYLGYLEAVNFLAVFGFLVFDFLLFGGINILIAILSFLMTRRLLASLRTIASDAVALTRQRHRIDPLIFLQERHVRRQSGNQRKLLHHFGVEARSARLLNILASSGIGGISSVESLWLDSGPPRTHLFDVFARNRSGEILFRGIEQVSATRHQQVLENEALIVAALGRDALRLPDVVHEYQVGEFYSRLMDLTGFEPVSQKEWRARYQAEYLASLWGIEPGRELRRVFELSRPYLHERLKLEMLDALEVAADTESKRLTLNSLRLRMEEICQTIEALPVFPYNRTLTPTGVYVDQARGLKVTHWGRWSLEPIGVGLDAESIEKSDLVRWAGRLQARMPRGVELSTSLLQLASRTYAFEEQVLVRGRFNEAMDNAQQMLMDLDEHQSGHGGMRKGQIHELNA